ncbi:MAG: hypothetical protein FJX75_15280 [Armatimonadetes bacterium]|nr:hypothetical protein [Armatimonadota bacterium]
MLKQMQVLLPSVLALALICASPPGSAEEGAVVAAVGPRGPVGPDVPLSDAERDHFAKRITVEGRTAQAVAEACQRAVEEGVPVVFLPAGEYLLDTEVGVPGGLTILGEGSKTVCRANELDTHLFRADGDRVRFTRLKLQGADTTTSTDNDSYGITISRVQNCRIDHCELLGFSYATTPSNECTAQIDHCYIHHNLRDGLGYGTSIYSGAYVLVTDNEFEQNRHSLASNGALDWSSPERVGKYLHKPGFRKTHWEFIHNRVGSNDLSEYELCAVDTHPGMDGTFVVEGNLFENLCHAIGIRDGAGLIRGNLFRNLRTVTTFRDLTAISITYGEHNGIPVDGCMPHSIQIAENAFLDVRDEQKYRIGRAENITIGGRLLPETRADRPAPAIPRLQEMGEDGVLRRREEEPTPPAVGSLTGTVTDEEGGPVAEATVSVGDRSATTDVDGRFAFENVTEVAQFVVATKPGFDLAIAALHVRPGQVSTVNVRLTPDRTPPRLLDVTIGGIAHTGAIVAWQTDELTTGELQYGTDANGGAGQTALATGDEPATTHRIELTDLAPTTMYGLRIRCTDVAGNAATSEQRRFTTGPVADIAPPEDWGYYSGAGSGIWGRTRREAHTGEFSAFLKAASHSRGFLNIGLVLSESDGYSGANAYPAQAGATYRYSFWLKGDMGGVRLVLTTWSSDEADQASRDHTNLTALPLTDEWARHEGEFTMPDHAKKFVLMFKVYAGGVTSDKLGVLYVDDVALTAGITQVLENGSAENG